MKRYAIAAALMLTSLLVNAAPASAAPGGVTWKPCPQISDEVIKDRYGDRHLEEFKKLWARTECGTISVPLDYRRPHGRKITVALSRLKATGKRLGSLALNPGGPGGSGYFMPMEVVLWSPAGKKLNEGYDLIGFDPRGVNYSSKVDCPGPNQPMEPEPGPLTEEAARKLYDAQVAHNRACSQYDPAFIGQLTTANIARDLDGIRKALRERKMNFFGVSWGTWLGGVYRSLFPQNVGLMWLDSVAIPDFRLDVFEDVRSDAAERQFSRMAQWLAERDGTYRLGTTAAQVRANLIALQHKYDVTPKKFVDFPFVIDGRAIAYLSGHPSIAWPDLAPALRDLREVTGDNAPESLKRLLGPEGPGEPPADAPEPMNRTLNLAAFCNEDAGPRRTFEQAWEAYRAILARNPVTGAAATMISAGCTGWELPAQPFQLRRSKAELVLSGHIWEVPSPYEWTTDTQRQTGGKVVTIDDDVHGSVLFEADCANLMADYFTTGKLSRRTCEGAQVPQDVPSNVLKRLASF